MKSETPAGKGKKIGSVAELLAHSLAMETEAAERYTELADQMEVHNNPEVAQLFRKLAEIEGKHVAQVESMSKGVELPHIPPWDYQWQGTESPEAPQDAEVHYLMTPYHAVELVLCSERRAASFFWQIAKSDAPKEVQEMARELAQEEEEHVNLLREWLSRYPAPSDDWDDDLDPPNVQE